MAYDSIHLLGFKIYLQANGFPRGAKFGFIWQNNFRELLNK